MTEALRRVTMKHRKVGHVTVVRMIATSEGMMRSSLTDRGIVKSSFNLGCQF